MAISSPAPNIVFIELPKIFPQTQFHYLHTAIQERKHLFANNKGKEVFFDGS
jgi:hypothetical protein